MFQSLSIKEKIKQRLNFNVLDYLAKTVLLPLAPQDQKKRLIDKIVQLVEMLSFARSFETLTDSVKSDAELKWCLLIIVKLSSLVADIALISGKSISILNFSKISLSSLDLSNVNLMNANLENAICQDTNFSRSILNSINFTNAWLQSANFTAVTTKDIVFNEKPYKSFYKCVRSCRYSPNSQWLAVASGCFVYLFSVINDEFVKTLKEPKDSIESVCFFPDSSKIAAVSYDALLVVWSLLGDFETLFSFKVVKMCQRPMHERLFGNGLTQLVVCSDNDRIYFSDTMGKIFCVSLAETRYKFTVKPHRNKVILDLAVSLDSKLVVSCGDDKALCFSSAEDGEEKKRILKTDICSVSFNNDGSMLVSASHNQLSLWCTNTYEKFFEHSLYCPNIIVQSMFTVSDKFLFICRPSGVRFSIDGKIFALFYGDNAIEIWSTEFKRCIYTIPSIVKPCSLDINASSFSVVFGGADRRVNHIDLNLASRMTYHERNDFNNALIVWHSKKLELIICSNQKTISFFDAITCEILGQKISAPDAITAVTINKLGSLLVTGHHSGKINIWFMDKYQCFHGINHHLHDVKCVQFCPDENYLLSAGSDTWICLWLVSKGELLHTFKKNIQAVYRVICKPNDDLFVSMSSDNSLRFWSYLSREYFGCIQCREISSICFDKFGRYFAWNDNKKIAIYDILSNQMEILSINERFVFYMNFNDSGDYLFYGVGNSLHILSMSSKINLKTIDFSSNIHGVSYINNNFDCICISTGHGIFIFKVHLNSEVVKCSLIYKSAVTPLIASNAVIVDSFISKAEEELLVQRGAIKSMLDKHTKISPFMQYGREITGTGKIRAAGSEELFEGARHVAQHEKDVNTGRINTPTAHAAEEIQKILNNLLLKGNRDRFRGEQIQKDYKLSDLTQPSLERGLRNAANKNAINDVLFFISKVNNINAQDENPQSRRTALHWAMFRKHTDVAGVLIKAGAQQDILDAAGLAPSSFL